MRDDPAGEVMTNSRLDTTGPHSGTLIVNADDWGRDARTTDRIIECVRHEAISSASAMVYTEDAERGAELARTHGVDTGLHLNLTMPFTAPNCPARLRKALEKLGHFLGRYRLAQVVYRPGLAATFEYVVKAQLEEYERLYGAEARRVDGHQHMHLCSNVILQRLLPVGTIVRRNFTFESGEKGYFNRLYRRWQDRRLARQHRMADYFFDLLPMEPRRLQRIRELATHHDVEVEAHVIFDDQYQFLMDGRLSQGAGGVPLAHGYILRGADTENIP
jgi:predicted glycoside hydrolase/deacetylase ChbG (UPF0249 family)